MKKILESKLDKRNKMCLDSKVIESLFVDDEFFSHVSSYKKINSGRYPKTDQWCDEECFNLAFALAGFSPEDISVTVKGNTLWVSTEKIVTKTEKESGFIHRGIAKRAFRKGYFLYDSLSLNKAEAKMKDGLLTIRIPFCSEDNDEKKIEVINE